MGIHCPHFNQGTTNDRSRKRRQGPREGRCQEASQGLEGQHSGHYQASHPTTCQKRRSQANQWSHLRRDQGCFEGVSGECCQRRRHLHGARQEEDCHCHGCCVCSQEAGQDSVRLRRLTHTSSK